MRCILLSVFLLFALPAHAIKIVNLDTVPHVLIVNNGGEIQEVTIEPDRFYTTYGPMVDIGLKPKGKTKAAMRRANMFGDYAIWPGGKLVLQMIRDPGDR